MINNLFKILLKVVIQAEKYKNKMLSSYSFVYKILYFHKSKSLFLRFKKKKKNQFEAFSEKQTGPNI